jgi:NAD(P)-dependent dehydrogenase (short-subunit alcohol dehydrogenase family)
LAQTILVTGTSTGLGFATAVSLARAGHDVYASMRNPAGAPELRTVAAHEKLPITILPLDVDSDASVAAGIRSVIEARGRIDVLVNNAGIGLMASIEHMPLDLSGDLYPGARRLDAIFAAALEQPVPASVVGDLIRDLVASDSWQLRYPAGPGAAPFLGWRGSLTDEQFIALGALDNDAWCDYFEQTFKLPVRRHLVAAGASTS